MLCLEGRKEVG